METSDCFVHRFECPEPLSYLKICGQNDAYETIFDTLIGHHEREFFDACWEKKPALFKRSKAVVLDAPSALFSKEYMLSVVSKFKLESEQNFNVVKYNGANKEVLDIAGDENGCGKSLSKAFKEGYTVQFFQPQRFSDMLYRINSSFENKFGTLAGASAYLTPSNTQGLAPHHDDVEVLILQLEGSKRWNLWDHLHMPHEADEVAPLPLPEEYSHDIDRELLPTIVTGSPSCQSVLLEEGDILYLPRGTIHEAVALKQFSTHATISVYQHYNYKAVISRMLQPIVETAFKEYMPLRDGLPLSLHRIAGSGAASFIEHGFNNGCKNQRTKFIEDTKAIVAELPRFVATNIIDTAVDEIVSDFMTHRLPPPSCALHPRKPLTAELFTSHKKSSKQTGGEMDEEMETKVLLRELDDSYDRWRIKADTDRSWNGVVVPKLLSYLKSPGNGEKKKAKRDSNSVESFSTVRVRMYDLSSVHLEVIDVEGTPMLSVTSCRFNSRLRHMGLQVPALIDDSLNHNENDDADESEVDGDDGDSASGSDDSIGDRFDKLQSKKRKFEDDGAGSVDESDGGSSEQSSFSEEGNSLLPWTVLVPLNIRPLVLSLLYHSENDGFAELSQLITEMKTKHNINEKEVLRHNCLSCGLGTNTYTNTTYLSMCLGYPDGTRVVQWRYRRSH
jgi:hypothetical protein